MGWIGTNMFIFPQKLGNLYNIVELFNAKSKNTPSFCGETSPKWQFYSCPKPNVHILSWSPNKASKRHLWRGGIMASKRICLSYCWRSKAEHKIVNTARSKTAKTILL